MTMKRKTRIERVYNEDTGWFETREVELNSYSFTDDDRIMIVREYMESGLPAEEIIKKYYISSRTVLFSWMDKFLNEKDLLSLPPEDQNRDDMAKTTNEQLKEKDAEIKRLRKALELEKLRSKAFSTMIDLAEETFNIPVRKNLVPNSKLAPHRVPEPRFRHSMRAVWFHPASI